MAFTATHKTAVELLNTDRSKIRDSLASALAAGVSSLTSLGGAPAVAACAEALMDVYRTHPGTAASISAAAVLSVAASSTTSLLTLQIQIIPAV